MISLGAPPVGTAVAGMGRITLDVVLRPGCAAAAQAGGTCGNVLANLAFLGWHALPLGVVGLDSAGQTLRADLARSGVDLAHLSLSPQVRTPVVLHRVPNDFSHHCPQCGERFAEVEPPSLAFTLGALQGLPRCRAFFFDRDSPESLEAARWSRRQGAVVVWEPHYAGPEVDLAGALAVSHIVKWSAAEVPGFSALLSGEGLAIETRGEAGVRYRYRGRWYEQAAVPTPVVRDCAGAGDWVTAALIHGLGQNGVDGVQAATLDEVAETLHLGQALAAYNCAFAAARGSFYAVSRERFDADIASLRAGQRVTVTEETGPRLSDAGRFCLCQRE